MISFVCLSVRPYVCRFDMTYRSHTAPRSTCFNHNFIMYNVHCIIWYIFFKNAPKLKTLVGNKASCPHSSTLPQNWFVCPQSNCKALIGIVYQLCSILPPSPTPHLFPTPHFFCSPTLYLIFSPPPSLSPKFNIPQILTIKRIISFSRKLSE